MILFDDGSSVPATAEALRAALAMLDTEDVAHALGLLGPGADRRLVRSLQEALPRFEMHDIASKPRNPVTKDDIVAFRDEWLRAPAKEARGWKAAACRQFGIDRKTLDARLTEE